MERQCYRCVWMCVDVCWCVLVCVCWCLCFVCWPTLHLGDPRLRRRVPLSHHSTHQWRGSTTGVCGCVLVCVCWCLCFVCWPTRHLGDPRLRRRVPLSHHSTHQWRGSTTGVCGCGCGCVLVGGCGCVLVWVCFVCWPTWHLGDSRLRRRVPLSHHSTHQWRGSTTGVCGCGWVGVGVCWCGCVLCVGPPGISEIPVFVGGSRSLTIPLTTGEAVLQVGVGVGGCWCVWVCVGVCVGVCWCGCVLCVGPPGISEIPVFVGGSRSLTIPLTNGEAVLQVCVGVWGVGISVSVLASVWVLVCLCWCVCVSVWVLGGLIFSVCVCW